MSRAAVVFSCLPLRRLPWQLRAQDAPAGDSTAQTAPAAAPERDVSWKELPGNILSDQKNIWLFPAHLRHRSALIGRLPWWGATAALVALDPKEGAYFRNTTAFNGFNRVVSGNNTSIGMVVAPLSFYAVGLIRKTKNRRKRRCWRLKRGRRRKSLPLR